MNKLSIYIHWPFCLSKCPYCDFSSRQMGEVDFVAWEKAYLTEIESYAKRFPDREIHTIYFGGGTPSLMPPTLVSSVLNSIKDHWKIEADAEITLEANPTSVEIQNFEAFRKAGVNRLSLGVQSLQEERLSFLGRKHSVDEAKEAVKLAASVFPRFSFDLIYATRGQKLHEWFKELDQALALAPKHISLYQLTIEQGSIFYKQKDKDTLTLPEEMAAEFYEETTEHLFKQGLFAYEVSNYAMRGEESRHNLVYWNAGDFIGLGPASHGRVTEQNKRVAFACTKDNVVWFDRIEQSGIGATKEELSVVAAQEEALLMGLRLSSGIDLEIWKQKFGQSFDAFVERQKINFLQTNGLLAEKQGRIFATDQGRMKLNTVLAYLL